MNYTLDSLESIKPKSYTGIYSMHKYWSKKPYNIINEYIKQFSKEGDIVLDPFCGSGISNIEANLLKRKTIGIDINPMAIFITKQTLQKMPVKKIEDEFLKLSDIKQSIDKLYTITRNKKSHVGTHFIYNNNILSEVWYKNKNNKKIIDSVKKSDIRKSSMYSYNNIDLPFPKTLLIKNSRINAKSGMRVCDLFTPRNALGLAMLLDNINKIKNIQIRNFFKFCFTSCLGQTSKMVFVINNRKKTTIQTKQQNRKEVGSWVIGYWIPKDHFEINVWNCFERRYNKILKAKHEQNNLENNGNFCHTFNDLKQDGNTLLINGDCSKILKKLPNNSIDYIITDPPHGDRLPYMELSTMWNSWLGSKTKMKDELIVSDARERNKNVDQYIEHLQRVLIEIKRIIKPNKYFTLMFNNYDSKTWKELHQMLLKLNFKLIDVNTIGYSAASVIQDCRLGGLKTDFIFTLKKESKFTNSPITVATESTIRQAINKYLSKYDNHALYKILNYVIIYLMNKKLLFDIKDVIMQISIRLQ